MDTGEGEIVFWPESYLMGNVEHPWFDSQQEQCTCIFRISEVPTPFLVSIASYWMRSVAFSPGVQQPGA